jgi:hypothetical protein
LDNSLHYMMLQSKINNHSSLILNHLYGHPRKRTSTKVYVRKNNLFMQNEPKSRKVKLKVNRVSTKDYDIMDTWSIGKNEPKRTQNEPKTNPKRTQIQKGQNERK